MSNRQEIQTEIRNMECLQRACVKRSIVETLEIAPQGQKVKARQYQGDVAGVAKVNLAGWQYPIVIQEDGTVVFDNHEGHWGNIKELNGLVAEYGEEVVMHQLIELEGHTLQDRQVLADGTVELTIGIGG